MMQRSDAETMALGVLAWAASDGQALNDFLGFSGLDLEELRARAAEPELLAAFMDFILGNEEYAAAASADQNLDAETLRAIRRALPGSALD